MKKNIYNCFIVISILSILAIWRSVSATASVALIAAGTACYLWDSRSRSSAIRKSAFSRNAHLIATGTLLFMLTLLTSGADTSQSSKGLTGFLWVISYAFAMTAAPVMVWQHFATRRYQMDKSRLAIKQRVTVTSNSPVFFQPIENNCQVKSFSYKPSRHQSEPDQRQLRMVV